ncbi:MAG: amidohydrolase [Chloroflexi bacterium]|nr:amidohydrolase [Chloroflexota bacterium]
MIVDTHMHHSMFPDDFRIDRLLDCFPELASVPAEDLKNRFHHPLETYLAETQGVVDKAIVHTYNFPESLGFCQSNDEVAERVNQYPDKFAWCCNINPFAKGAAREFERCVRDLGAVGMGEWGPSYQFFHTNDKRCFPVYEKAIELDVPIIIHAGPAKGRTCRLAYANVWDLDEVAIMYPQLRIVICHIGFPKYEDTVLLMQKHANVFADIAWLPNLAGLDMPEKGSSGRRRGVPAVRYPYYHFLYPLVYYLSGASGLPDKLLFGTDFSSVDPVKYINTLENINDLTRQFNLPEIPPDTVHAILHENWRKVFKLQQAI